MNQSPAHPPTTPTPVQHRRVYERRESMPLAVCYGLALLGFIVFFVLIAYAEEWVFGPDAIGWWSQWGLSEPWALMVFIATDALLAYLSTRLLFRRLAYKLIWTSQPFCPCGYNLTGNVSGICPECGERI